MFTAHSDNYENNMWSSETIAAAPARITAPTGEHLPGVVVFTRGKVSSIVTAEAAHRLATEIVDSLESLKSERPVRRSPEVNAAFAALADQ